MSAMTPREIVHELNKHIVGQEEAKRAVAIALRNRWRRMQLDSSLRDEITPKNILMIGPTGVGKTEIARRLAKLADAPFLKVEATKFTEVGYVGRDVESIIRDLADMAVKMLREAEMKRHEERALDAAEERILDALIPPPRDFGEDSQRSSDSSTRQLFRKKLREGELDDKEIEIDLRNSSAGVEIMAPPGMEEMTNQLQSMFSNLSSDKRKTRKMKVSDASSGPKKKRLPSWSTKKRSNRKPFRRWNRMASYSWTRSTRSPSDRRTHRRMSLGRASSVICSH